MSRRTGTTRYAGLNSSSVSHTSRRFHREQNVLKAAKQNERLAAAEKKRRRLIKDMTLDERLAVASMDADEGIYGEDVAAVDMVCPSIDTTIDVSHEGGEVEMFSELASEITNATGHRIDDRVRRDRIQRQNKNWDIQMDLLVQGYLYFRSIQGMDGLSSGNNDFDTEAPSIHVIDLFFRRCERMKVADTDRYPNETLIRNGFLGCSPLNPSIALSIRTLNAFRQLRRQCARLSVQGFCRTLCLIHCVPYQPYLARQFSDAYDVYLQICGAVDRLLDEKLGICDGKARLRSICPPCFYRLKDEPQLTFSALVSMDGNNSLKRIGASVRAHQERPDLRKVTSHRWLTSDEVDQFANEVTTTSTTQAAMQAADEEPFDENATDIQDSAEPTSDDSDMNLALPCTDRWKNASPDERKSTLPMFDESGIFISTCRHRIILYCCDMIKSGELSKYPLAIVKHLLQDVGEKIGCAYDIGCVFQKTLANSSLGQEAKEKSFRLMVGAFHGHAHNRACQLRWHPLYIQGTGKSEGEGCEHVFSASNDLARTTRFASRFHRQQAIEEYFTFWDQEKYALLSKFISNHYHNASEEIYLLGSELKEACALLKLDTDDFIHHIEKERVYLESLKKPPPDVEAKGHYVEALNELQKCRQEWDDARASVNRTLERVAPANTLVAVAQARQRVETAYAKLQNAEGLVGTLEQTLNISERWTADSPEYKRYHEENIKTKYQEAIDHLERLVIMRLFELTKMCSSGIGYRLRRHIAKALQRRSAAIRKAIIRYNAQAAKLNPSRPPLSWKDVVDFSFLGEFDVLRFFKLQSEEWMKPVIREATVKYFRLCRAREEIERLNVEVRRLRKSIEDEANNLERVSKLLDEEGLQLLAGELRHRERLRSEINQHHLDLLDKLESSPYFTGNRGSGMRTDTTTHGNDVDSTLADEIEDQDAQQQDFETVADFILSIDD